MGISDHLHVYGKGVCTGTIDPPTPPPPPFPFPFVHYCPSMPFWNKCLSILFSLFDLNLMNNFSLWKIGHLTLWKDDSAGAEMIFESLVKIKMMPEYLKIVIIKSLVKKK